MVKHHNRIHPLPHAPSGLTAYVGRPVWNEARKPFELRALRKSALWHGDGVPIGHGRPVVLIPGFLAGRHSAVSLAHILGAAGWVVATPDVGRNAGPAMATIDAAVADVKSLVDRTGQPVTIIGHSRGGQLGRVIAVEHPELVRQVVVAGTPLRTKYPKYLVVKLPAEALDKAWRWGLFGWTDPRHEDWVDDRRYVDFPDDVDLVSVWSRLDGVVDWRLCIDPAAANIEVRSSHQGLFNGIQGIRGIVAGLSRQDEPELTSATPGLPPSAPRP